MSKQEMVKVKTWVLCLCNEDTGIPTHYYNSDTGEFQTNFNTVCAFMDEKSCLKKQNELNIEGLQMVKGTMDYPKDLLIDIIMESFEESGLI